MNIRRCFFLGAGFSRCCDLPLASELTHLVFRAAWRSNLEDESPVAPLVTSTDPGHEVMQGHLAIIRVLFPDARCDPDDSSSWPDFEVLISALDEADQFQSAFERTFLSGSLRTAHDCKVQLLKALEHRLCELSRLASPDGRALLDRFVRRLRTSDSVVSFNWDVLLEETADNAGIGWSYSLWDKGCLTIARPHGALSLAELTQTKFDELKRASNYRPLTVERQFARNGEPWVLVRAEAREAEDATVWPLSATLLVEPSTRKRYDSPWLDWQWTLAMGRARVADEWIVIGFSLPPADHRPRILMQVSQLQRPVAPRLVIVDPNATKLRDHYRGQIGLDAAQTFDSLEAWVRAQESESAGR